MKNGRVFLLLQLCFLIHLLSIPALADCPLSCSEIILSSNGSPITAILLDTVTSQTVTVHSESVIDHTWQVTEIARDSVILRDVRSGQLTRLMLQPSGRLVSQPLRTNPAQRLSTDPRNGKRQIMAPVVIAKPQQTQSIQPSFTFGLPGDREKKAESDYRFPAGR